MTMNLCFIEFPLLVYEDCCEELMQLFDESSAGQSNLAQIEHTSFASQVVVPLDACPAGSTPACDAALDDLNDLLD